VTRTRSTSNDFTGTVHPVVIEMRSNQLHFYRPEYLQGMKMNSKIANQIELQFQPPLFPPVVFPQEIIRLINTLRMPIKSKEDFGGKNIKNLKADEIRFLARQLFYEGSINKEIDAPLRYLYALYLNEFLYLLQSKSKPEIVTRNEGLSFFSFLSLDQLATDMVESLGKTMVDSFQEGFEKSLRSSAVKDAWKKLIKNKSIISLAYCPNCKKVVRLTSDQSCPTGRFHKVGTPSYFHENEEVTINNFLS
jgi:hypothetical protein